MRHIVFLQMLGYLAPAATNQRTSLTTASSPLSTISVVEPTMAAQRGHAASYRHAEAMIATARDYRLVNAAPTGVAKRGSRRRASRGAGGQATGAAPPAG
jgi:ABC-type amino acid transport system permease subunit